MTNNINYPSNSIASKQVVWITKKSKAFLVSINNTGGLTISANNVGVSKPELSRRELMISNLCSKLKEMDFDTKMINESMVVTSIKAPDILVQELAYTLLGTPRQKEMQDYMQKVHCLVVASFASSIYPKIASVRNAMQEHGFLRSSSTVSALQELSHVLTEIVNSSGDARKLDTQGLSVLRRALNYQGRFADAPAAILQIIEKLSLAMPVWMLESVKNTPGRAL